MGFAEGLSRSGGFAGGRFIGPGVLWIRLGSVLRSCTPVQARSACASLALRRRALGGVRGREEGRIVGDELVRRRHKR